MMNWWITILLALAAFALIFGTVWWLSWLWEKRHPGKKAPGREKWVDDLNDAEIRSRIHGDSHGKANRPF
jgi:hypothetical protein